MDRHALLIGNSRYPDAPSLGDLRWPGRDVDDFAELLRDPDLGQFGDHVRVLKDHPSHEIETLIHDVLLVADKNDLVVIYFSGHGKRDRAGNLWLAAVDTNVDRLQTTAVEVRRIRNLVNEKPHRRVVLILDCCYAAAAGGPLRNSVEDELQQVAEQPGGQGFYILAASGATQTSQEKETDVNGLYTKHLLAGIRTGAADADRDGWIAVDELHGYVREQVLAERPEQQPRMWGMDTDDRLIIARSHFKPREERVAAIRQRLLELAAGDYIDDDLLTEALRIARQPVEALDEAASRKDRLLDDLREDKLKPADLMRAWIQAGSANTGIAPEPVQTDVPDSKEDSGASEREQSPAAPSRGQWIERLKVGFFMLAVGGFIVGLIIKDQVFDRAEMPSLTGTLLDEARATLDKQRWKYDIRRHFNPAVDSGTILDQNPPAGTEFKPSEDRILLLVAESAIVPDLVNLKLAQARELLNLRGLTLAEPETRIDPTRPAGTVLDQNPPAGRKVEPGTMVKLVVANDVP